MLISEGEWGLPHRNLPTSTVPSHIILSQLREEAVVRPFLTSPGGSLHPRVLYKCPNKSSPQRVQDIWEQSLAVWFLCHRDRFQRGWSSCVKPMSNGDEPALHRLWPAAEGKLPPETGDRILSPCMWCWLLWGRSGVCLMTLCIHNGNLKSLEMDKGRNGVLGVIFNIPYCWVKLNVNPQQDSGKLSWCLGVTLKRGMWSTDCVLPRETTFLLRAFPSRDAVDYKPKPQETFLIDVKKLALNVQIFTLKINQMKLKWFVLLYFETVYFMLS